ncbi:MAG: hypothetical protein KJO43_05190 [Phycisphaerae bacterium]|nr:hypothetical protein [Phycisphaerae bacterium]NNF41768.1 hypothetical protein [Phycisphaerales bacterium]
MAKYLCRAEIFFRPGAANDPAYTKTQVDTQVHPNVAHILRHDFVLTAGDREALFDETLKKLNDLQQLHAFPDQATKTTKNDWAYGSGGLHEDVRRVDQNGALWIVNGDQTPMYAHMRLVSDQIS